MSAKVGEREGEANERKGQRPRNCSMDDVEYIRKVDAHFPFRRARKWKAVIDQGISLSDNAAYMALFAVVVARPSGLPRSETQRMMDYWSSKYDHPTKPVVLAAARAILSHRLLPEAEALTYLDTIAAYRGLCNALGFIYEAATPGEHIGDTTEAVARRYREIVAHWQETS